MWSLRAVVGLALLTGCPKPPPEVPVPDPSATTTPTDAPPVEAPPTEAPPTEDPKPAGTSTVQAESTSYSAEERTVNDAVELLLKGDASSRSKAVALLEGVTKKDPSIAHAWFNLGVAAYQEGDVREAREQFETAAQKDPTFGAPYLYLGVLDDKEMGREAAIRTWRTGIERDPENMDLRVAVIGALRDSGQVDAAITEAKAALKINSNSLPVYNNLGLIYLEKGQLDLAMFVYQKAIQSVPDAENNVYIRTNMGRIYFERDEKGPALYHLLAAVKLDPSFVPASIYLATIYQDDHNYADMVPLLESAAKGAPDNHGVQMNLGIAYRGVGKYPEAKVAYEKALKLDPANPDPYLNLGILYGDYMKTPEGVRMYDESITAFNTYLSMGGAEKDLTKTYIEGVEKDKKKYLKKKEKEAADVKKKADAAAAAKAEEEARKNAPPPEPPPPEPPPPEPAPEPQPEGAPQ